MKNQVNHTPTNEAHILQSVRANSEEIKMLLNLVESKGDYDPKKLLPFLDAIIEEIDKRKMMRGL
jgi:hypothetical protein